MGDDTSEISCANPDCRVVESGRCVEGLECTACPNYGREMDSYEDGGSNAPSGQILSTCLDLVGAGTLTCAQASKLLRANESRVIAIIGPQDTGKTSLIAGLYDLFQLGPVDEINFSGSRTLHAFEQACHDARAASKRGTPHINRTPLGEVQFYHLELSGGNAGTRLSLMLGDRAGEDYMDAINDISVVDAFPEIRRADLVTMLVDGKKLLDSGARHNLISDVTMILQALVEGAATSGCHRLALVLTKIDLLHKSDLQSRVERDFDNLVSNIRKNFAGMFDIIEPFAVAASPMTDSILRGTGLRELLRFWLTPALPPAHSRVARLPSSRAFGRLTALIDEE